MINGAFGHGEDIGYTLYYATNFIFTGLAFAVAFHAGLFNIGAEGQAYIGGLGVALVVPLARPDAALVSSIFPLAIIGSAAVRRGSGLSFPAICRPSAAATSSSRRSCSISSPSALMVYLLVSVLKPLGIDGAGDAHLRRGRPAAEA